MQGPWTDFSHQWVLGAHLGSAPPASASQSHPCFAQANVPSTQLDVHHGTMNMVHSPRRPLPLVRAVWEGTLGISLHGQSNWNKLQLPFHSTGLGGGSASGKTTVARMIIEALDVPWVVLLSMDSFYKVRPCSSTPEHLLPVSALPL